MLAILIFIVGLIFVLFLFAFCIRITAKLLKYNQPSYGEAISAMIMSFIISLILAIFIAISTGLDKTVSLYQDNLIFSLLLPLIIGAWSYSIVLRLDILKATLVYIISSVVGTVVIVGLVLVFIGSADLQKMMSAKTFSQPTAEIEHNPIDLLDSESAIPED
jgi:hypothetical protein